MQALLAFVWSEHMDGLTLELPLFLLATFAGAFVDGLSGFAFGLVAASIWLYILTPLQSASLIVGFGLLVQGYSVWKLRRTLDWRRLWPFVAGAALGVPAGVTLLTWLDPRSVRIAVGVFLVIYSVYAFLRPTLKPVTNGGAAADATVGFLNGVLGGLTGLARHSGDYLVRIERLAQGRAALDLPAGGRRDLSDERPVARSEGNHHP
jgi:uncharacterized protein